MGKKTGITWTDHTLNWWWGCSEITPACDNCYARELAARFKGMSWGRGTPRIKIKSAPKMLRDFDKMAKREGVIKKVFAHSMSDIFDHEVPDDLRREEFKAMAFTENLVFQFLTKRPGLIDHSKAPYPVDKVWLGTSLGSNDDIQLARELVKHPAKLHWISYEPAIGPLNVDNLPDEIRWIVIGGESGANARTFVLSWAYDVIRNCRLKGIPVFVKQLGRKPYSYPGFPYIGTSDSHGKIVSEWPEGLRVQEFPRSGLTGS